MALKAEFGEVKVNMAFAAWNNTPVTQVTYIRSLNQIIAAGSPGGGWPIFKKFYAAQSAAENTLSDWGHIFLLKIDHSSLGLPAAIIWFRLGMYVA